jgi:tetratricopeptide (TPR) repeat protein
VDDVSSIGAQRGSEAVTEFVTQRAPLVRPENQGSLGRWLRGLGITIGALVIVNGALFVLTPELFRVDLAKGPYTEANNLELTRVYHRAIPLYERVIETYPESDYALLARIGVANSNVGLGKRDLALEQYTSLLATLDKDAAVKDQRYQILARMAGLYRDNADNEGFGAVFAMLAEEYPDSQAVREGRDYLDRVKAEAQAATPALPADFPFRIDPAAIVVPNTVKVGEVIEITIPVAPAAGRTPDFSLMTSLPLYQGLSVKQILPNPRSVADFWGRRAWQFAGIAEPIEVKAQLVAKKAGTYVFDLDVEMNFDIVELGISHSIQVED